MAERKPESFEEAMTNLKTALLELKLEMVKQLIETIDILQKPRRWND